MKQKRANLLLVFSLLLTTISANVTSKQKRQILKEKALLKQQLIMQDHIIHKPKYRTSSQPAQLNTLCGAASAGDLETLTTLVVNGENVNMQDCLGKTPLHHAIRQGNAQTIEHLLLLGADPNIQDNQHKTPREHALKLNDKEIQALLVNDVETRLHHLPIDISFVISDLKFDKDGNVKILELGEGPRSYFKGHETLYGKGKIWESMWHYFSQLGLPVWYVGRKPDSLWTQATIGGKKFIEIGGQFADSLTELKRDPLFQKLAALPTSSQPQALAECKGIIVLRHHYTSKGLLQDFKKNYPDFIILDSVTSAYVNNKYTTSLLFNDDRLKAYKPRWKAYPKIYTKDLAQTIINDLKTNTVVLKPLSAANGWGVLIVDKHDLDTTLRMILKNTASVATNPDKSYNYWAQDRNRDFLVEEYVPSKTITVRGKEYDATMRVVFLLSYHDGKIYTTFLGHYWKLPLHALDADVDLTKKHKSKIGSNDQIPSSAKVAPEDCEQVKKVLQEFLPKIYLKMLLSKQQRSTGLEE
ncbi:ankyrin repeat domain-containing protein [Candidatus Babeliales bacterium]|nr:ankyrin repeat domain-containing protein [Candidatus Babeliales bacterium]